MFCTRRNAKPKSGCLSVYLLRVLSATDAARRTHEEFLTNYCIQILQQDVDCYTRLSTCTLPSGSTSVCRGCTARPKIHQCGISRKSLTLNSSLCTFLSAVVAADWLQLDGGMEA